MERKLKLKNISYIIFLCAACVFIVMLLLKNFRISIFAPYWDSSSIVLSILNIDWNGVPLLRPKIDSPNFIPSPGYHLNWEYALEAYLRYPFYWISKYVSYDWETWSSQSYAFAALTFVAIVFRKIRCEIPLISFAFFLILFGHSNFASEQFHFVRYYPFTVLSMSLCHTSCCFLFIERNNIKFPLVKVLLISAIPAFFHQLNLSLFAFWSIVIIGDIFFLKLTIKRMLKPLMLPVAFLFLGLFILLPIVYNNIHYLKISQFNRLVFERFALLNMDTNIPEGVIIPILFTLLIIKNRKKISKPEIYLLSSSLGFIVFSLTFFSFVGSNKILAPNPTPYYLFLHPIWLLVLAVCLSQVWMVTVERFSFRLGACLFTFFLISFMFTSIYQYNAIGASITNPQVTKEFIRKLEDEFRAHPYSIVIAGETLFFFTNFASVPAFLLGDFDEREVVNENETDSRHILFYDQTHHVRNIYGERYIGKKNLLCETLKNYRGWEVIFYFIENSVMESALKTALIDARIKEGQFIKIDSFYKMVCYSSLSSREN